MNNLMTKSFQSYVDLKKEAIKDLKSSQDLEMGMSEMDQNLSTFLEEAEHVKSEMNSIRDILIHLEELNTEAKAMLKPEALKDLKTKTNSDIVTVLKKARAIKSRLEAMDRDSAMSRELYGCKEGTPVDRTRSSVTNGLRKKLKDLMMEFQELRQRMMNEYKETIGRRYYTVTGEYPADDVLDKIIESNDGHGGEEFLSKAIQEHGKEKVVETVVEIQDRHDAAKAIERSLLELHQIFMDMAVMVEAQGEKMDDIEHHVFNAAHYINDGTKNLQTAKVYQRSSRRCMCIGIILLLVLILVIFIPIITSLTS